MIIGLGLDWALEQGVGADVTLGVAVSCVVGAGVGIALSVRV
jgi:hypothetical protein